MNHASILPCDVLGKVVLGVYLQGVCSSGVLRKQSQRRWCSMPLHMAGSQPEELTTLFHPSLFLSVNVCHSLCFFLSSAPAAHVSVGLSVCPSVCVSDSGCLFPCVCAVQMLLTSPADQVPPDNFTLLQQLWILL